MSKSIIIAGAGIAGLSAGCYARMNGYRTSIYEMHKIPGGLCTAWERKGYKWDISMHMLSASAGCSPIHQMWEELGIPQKFSFHYHDHGSLIEKNDQRLLFTTNRKDLEDQMLFISPEDSKLIKEFLDLIFGPDMMKAASLKAGESKNIFDRMKIIPAILPLMKYFIKYNNISIQQFAAGFKNTFLQDAVRFFIDAPGWPMPDFPMIALAGFVKSGITEAGSPIGGSQQVVFHMADLFKELGGEMNFNKKISNLIIEKDRVKGIVLDDGTEHPADEVIWAGDGHNLIFNILKGKYMDERISRMYEEWEPVQSMLHVMIGVNRDMSREPHSIVFESRQAVRIAGKNHHWINFLHHCFDKLRAPEGKSAVEVWYATDYDYWTNLYPDKKKYKAEKNRIASESIALLDKRWPGFASQVEVTDVATPATYTRYTGNWNASPDGWYITTKNMRSMDPVLKLPGLEGLHMAGQWTSPFTGTVIASLSGRQVIEVICRKDGVKFNTKTPEIAHSTVPV